MTAFIARDNRAPDESETLPGQLRGYAEQSSFFSPGLTRPRGEQGRVAGGAKDYPSPPMSESPPLPSKPTHEAGDRSQGSYHYNTDHDAYRGTSTATIHNNDPVARPPLSAGPHAHHQHHQQQFRHSEPLQFPRAPAQRPPAAPLSASHLVHPAPNRPYTAELPDRLLYPSQYARTEESSISRNPPAPSSYPTPRHLQGPPMSSYPYLPPLPGPGSMQLGYPPESRPSSGAQIQSQGPLSAGGSDTSSPYASPKTQRKTKGHVASACVPCKRAHLRCDAQRPCSRCLSNGKEDACVDVQHKKRGRPRLREERDLRYELSGRGGPSSHPNEVAFRRPIPILYGQPPAPIAPGYDDHAHLADPNAYPTPLTIATRPPEPAAFLSTDLEIAKASGTFVDAIGRSSLKGLTLLDVVSVNEREKVMSLQRQMQDERNRKDPQYLPPIFAKRDQDRIVQSLGFGPEEMSRYALEFQEFLTFSTVEGHQRTFRTRVGLAKFESIYLIVMLLHVAPPSMGHPTPSPHARDVPFSYPPLQQQGPPPPPPPHPQQQVYGHPPPSSATFDNRPRMPNDGMYGAPPRPPSGPPPPIMPGLSPGAPPPYAVLSNRVDYPPGSSPSYQTPRSELTSAPRNVRPPAQVQPPMAGGYQLAPIRTHPGSQPPPRAPVNARDERSRFDIGGLIDKPEPSTRPS